MSQPSSHRSLDDRGRVLVKRIGVERSPMRDLYLSLLALSWTKLVCILFVTYIAINAVFGLLFMLGGDCVEHVHPGSYVDNFFFSVQTFSTIGYGDMAPKNLYAHLLVGIEAFCGILCVALITGLLFSKFSRPHARITFSNRMAVDSRRGIPTLTLRLANHRSSHIIEGNLRLTLLRDESDTYGESFRRFYDLKLQRHWTPLFALTWSVFHEIDEDSPLFGLSSEDLRKQQIELIASFIGVDETFNQSVNARAAYSADQIVFNAKFRNIVERDGDSRIINYKKFHDILEE